MANISVLLIDGFADWEYALVSACARAFFQDTTQFLSPSTEQICSIGGLRTSADLALRDWKPADSQALLVIGSALWEKNEFPETVLAIRSAWDAGLVVGAICAGTLAVGRAGLLNERRHTSNSLDFLKQNLPAYTGSALYQDQAQAVSDSRLVTAPGSAPATFAKQVLELLHPDRLDQVQELIKLCSKEFAG